MRTLTPTECETWLRDAGVRTVGDLKIDFERPSDSYVEAQLSRFMVDWLGPYEATLLWLTDWPHYQPDEMALVSGLRRSHGDTRPLIDSPGHVFDGTEAAELTGWISLIVRFAWDGHVLPRPFRGDTFNTSHHDTIQVFSATADRHNEMREAVRFFGLKIEHDSQAD